MTHAQPGASIDRIALRLCLGKPAEWIRYSRPRHGSFWSSPNRASWVGDHAWRASKHKPPTQKAGGGWKKI